MLYKNVNMKFNLSSFFYLFLTLAMLFLLNTKIGPLPPLAKFLDPFNGFWQQAEPRQMETESTLNIKGLTGKVNIYFDENRIPHIEAENEEDLYAGIEHQQTPEVIQCLKLISRPGCEKIVRYGFEYAVRNKRKKVTCFTKDNIMKMTDGLFHKVFDEIGAEYPDLEKER